MDPVALKRPLAPLVEKRVDVVLDKVFVLLRRAAAAPVLPLVGVERLAVDEGEELFQVNFRLLDVNAVWFSIVVSIVCYGAMFGLGFLEEFIPAYMEAVQQQEAAGR